MREPYLVKIIRTASFNKLSKKKEWDPNPWAVCTDSVGREDKDKYERCVQEVKQKQCKDFEDKNKNKPEMVKPFKR